MELACILTLENTHDRSQHQHQPDHDPGEVNGKDSVQDDEDVVIGKSRKKTHNML